MKRRVRQRLDALENAIMRDQERISSLRVEAREAFPHGSALHGALDSVEGWLNAASVSLSDARVQLAALRDPRGRRSS